MLTTGTPTAIGSLPHVVPERAAALVLRCHERLPAAPQLPERSPQEAILAQVASGIDGVDVYPSGNLRVDVRRLDPEAPVAAPDPQAWGGLRAFLDAVHRAPAKPDAVKVQLAGPLTLGLALVRAGAEPAVAFPVAAAAVKSAAAAMLALVRSGAPDARVVAFLDEPGLTAYDRDTFPLDADSAVDLLSGALAALSPATTTGVHCCGDTDWRLVTMAGPDVLSLPTGEAVNAGADILGPFLEHGGWIAWGAIPTHAPIGDGSEVWWRRLVSAWSDLIAGGCDATLIRQQSLVTPACGLAGHGSSQAERVLRLTNEVAERVRDQAAGARFSVGA
jgi:methionine synthase II (cobalamin-independent)